MTRLWTEGFEMGDLLFFDSQQGSINTSVVRSGARSWQVGANAMKNFSPALAEAYFRMAFRATPPTGASWFFKWRKGTTELGTIRWNLTSMHLEAYTGTGTLVGTGTANLAWNTWYVFEFHIRIADTGGVIEVKIDGTYDIQFTGDTKPGADADFDNVQWAGLPNGTVYIDDMACNDTNGTEDNSWPGDGRVYLILPNANGDVSLLTGSDGNSVDNYLLVDEVPKDDDATYVASASAGQYDLYNLQSIPALSPGDVITRLFVEARARETVAAGDSIQLGVKTNGIEYWSSNQPCAVSYKRHVGPEYKTNPQTGAAWTEAEVNALQAGVKVV